MSICNHDCLNCIYDDCICDDDFYDDLELDLELDREAKRLNPDNHDKKKNTHTKEQIYRYNHSEKGKQAQMRYNKTNKAKERNARNRNTYKRQEYLKKWKEQHKEEMKEYQKNYYLRKKEMKLCQN